MLTDRQTTYPVVDEPGPVVGVVSLEHLRRGRRQDADTVREFMSETALTVSPDTPMFEAVGPTNRAEAKTAIVEENGEVAGVVAAAALTTALRIRWEAGTGVSPRAAM